MIGYPITEPDNDPIDITDLYVRIPREREMMAGNIFRYWDVYKIDGNEVEWAYREDRQ